MARKRTYLVKEVAEIAGVSVRTLHHYDEIELLVPVGRTEAGYRLYDDDDLLRLQQILLGRELGLTLEEIRRSLTEPDFDRREALLAQRAELEKRAEQTAEMRRAVDAALALLDQAEAGESAESVSPESLFDGFDPSRYEAEAEQRWGHTDAFVESRKRTRHYTREDWQRFAAEQAAIYGAAVEALRAGKPPTDPDALAAAERHRESIERWFYPCSHEMHCNLATMYEQDPRFAENIDKYGPGLSPFLVSAIRENARRQAT
ncbi:MAG TPA: MerR family transcriptional regulator [Polyangiaceae bacterium]|nr:MerR family transcriptional regulator [Polyangiaceae bacterium]